MSACACGNSYDLCIQQGATFRRVITWKADGALVNLTGYTARMQIRATAEAATSLIELTTANNRIALGGAAGTITLTISATDTAALTAGRAVYDLELVAPDATVTCLIGGVVTIPRNITR
jgi:hypothetical protein